jgi:hypothetical protein
MARSESLKTERILFSYRMKWNLALGVRRIDEENISNLSS